MAAGPPVGFSQMIEVLTPGVLVMPADALYCTNPEGAFVSVTLAGGSIPVIQALPKGRLFACYAA